MNYAPITLFVYKRPRHARQTVEALQKNEFAADSDLIIISDAPKDEEASPGVHQVREYIKTITGFRSLRIIERENNYGLARSVISGVSDVLADYGKIIVLEDDMVTSPWFLKYINEALELYSDEEKVASIHGYTYPVRKKLPETFFIRGADCWGWGTWQRAWSRFEPDGANLLKQLQANGLTQRFDYDGACPYTAMLQDQITGLIDSWAIRWHASAFIRDMLTLYPKASLVRNIGCDNSGTHCDENDLQETKLAAAPIDVMRLPVEENLLAWNEFRKSFEKTAARKENHARESFISRLGKYLSRTVSGSK